MNAYSEMSANNYTYNSTVHGFTLVPEDKRTPPAYMETSMGPWGWQWRDGVRGLVLVPPSQTRITIKVLMDNIEKRVPGMYKTVTDMAFSRSPECPFIIDELSMAELRGRLDKYENENTLLSPDAQTGMRKSIAAALGERKSLIPEGEIYGVVYPYSVDVEHVVDGLCGPRQPIETSPVSELDSGSGTMSMDLGSEDDTVTTPLEPVTSLKVVGSRICQEVVGVEKVYSPPGRGM